MIDGIEFHGPVILVWVIARNEESAIETAKNETAYHGFIDAGRYDEDLFLIRFESAENA